MKTTRLNVMCGTVSDTDRERGLKYSGNTWQCACGPDIQNLSQHFKFNTNLFNTALNQTAISLTCSTYCTDAWYPVLLYISWDDINIRTVDTLRVEKNVFWLQVAVDDAM